MILREELGEKVFCGPSLFLLAGSEALTQGFNYLSALIEFKQMLIAFGILDHDGCLTVNRQDDGRFGLLHLPHYLVTVTLESR